MKIVFLVIFRLILAFLVNFKLSLRLKRLEFLLKNIKCNMVQWYTVAARTKATLNHDNKDITLYLQRNMQSLSLLPEGIIWFMKNSFSVCRAGLSTGAAEMLNDILSSPVLTVIPFIIILMNSPFMKYKCIVVRRLAKVSSQQYWGRTEEKHLGRALMI